MQSKEPRRKQTAFLHDFPGRLAVLTGHSFPGNSRSPPIWLARHQTGTQKLPKLLSAVTGV